MCATRFDPSAPRETVTAIEEILEKKLILQTVLTLLLIFKKTIAYFKDESEEAGEKIKKVKTLTKNLKSFETFVNIATIYSYNALPITGIALSDLPISTETAC